MKSSSLTKVELEIFDRIIVKISNSDVLSSTVLNYTIKLKNVKNFYRFKRQIQAPQDIGMARVNIDLYNEEIRKEEEKELRDLHNQIVENDQPIIYAYTFTMRFPYEGFRIKIDKIDKLCQIYKETFGIKPKFHIFNCSNEISVKFRILTLNNNIFLYNQADFANDLYKIILSKN